MDKNKKILINKEIDREFKEYVISLHIKGNDKIFFSVISRWAGRDEMKIQEYLRIAEEYDLRIIW